MANQQLGPTQAYFPKRVNGALKIGVIHFSTIKIVAIVMTFGIYLEVTNVALLISIVLGWQMEKLQNRFGKGVLRHTMWRVGLWIVEESSSLPNPGVKKFLR